METAWIDSRFNGDSCWKILGNVAFMKNGDGIFVRGIVRSWSVLKGFIETSKAKRPDRILVGLVNVRLDIVPAIKKFGCGP